MKKRFYHHPASPELRGQPSVSTAAFQAVYLGSIPVTRSKTADVISIVADSHVSSRPLKRGGQVEAPRTSGRLRSRSGRPSSKATVHS
jgi:hypothetical protein